MDCHYFDSLIAYLLWKFKDSPDRRLLTFRLHVTTSIRASKVGLSDLGIKH